MTRFLLIIFIISVAASAQTIAIHQINTEDYPLVDINFAVMDESGNAKNIGDDDRLNIDLCSPIKDYELTKHVGSGYVLLLLDKSGSMREEMVSLKKAVKYFIDLLPEHFHMSLVSFDRSIKVLADFTQDRSFLKAATDRLHAKGATALYDSVYYSLQSLALVEDPSRFLIVLTDGIDQTYDGSPPLSRHKLKEVLSLIRELNIPVNTISLGDQTDRDVLEKIADAGGGFMHQQPKGRDLSALYKRLAENLGREYNLRFYSPYLVYDGRELALSMELFQPDADYHADRKFRVPDLGEGDFYNYKHIMPTPLKGEQGVKIIVSDMQGHPINGYYQVLVNGQVVSKGRVAEGEGDFTLEQHEVNRNFVALSDQKVVRERPAVQPSRLYLYTITKDNTFVPMEVKMKGRYNHKYYIFNTTPDGLGESQRLATIAPGEYILEIGQNGQILMYDTIKVREATPLVQKYTFSRIVVAYGGKELPPPLKMGLTISIKDNKQKGKYVLKGKRLFYFVGNDSTGYLPPGDYEITLNDFMEGDKTTLITRLKYKCVTFGDEEIYTNIPREKIIISTE